MTELICDKCASKIPTSAKFCPSCGDPVTEADEVRVPVSSSGISKIKISFGHSTSRAYSTAVEVSSNVPTFETTGEGRDSEHQLILDATDVELAVRIWDLVGGWKSSSMSIDGQQISKKDLVYGGLGCFSKQQMSPRKEQYCFGLREFDFNIWGCHRLGMPFHGWAQWLRAGRFDGNGIWHFDKAKLRQELELKIHENQYCPLLSPDRVYETLDRIPDVIDPKTDPNWEYITERDYEDGYMSYKEVAIGIRPVLESAVGSYVVSEFRPEIPEEEGHDSASQTIEISIGSGRASASPSRMGTAAPKKTSSGCLGLFLFLIGSGALLGMALLI